MNTTPKEELLTLVSLAHYQRIALKKLGDDKYKYPEVEWILHLPKTIIAYNLEVLNVFVTEMRD